MGEIVTDLKAWPLVMVRLSDQPSPPIDADYQAFFDGQRDLFRRGMPFASVVDVQMRAPASPVQRRMMTAWLQESELPMRRLAVGLAIVTRSALIRGALRAVLWVKEPAAPTRIAASVFEGIAYCVGELERHRAANLDPARKLLDEARRSMA